MNDVLANEFPGPQSGRRRRFSLEEKRRFLAEANAPGESMSSVGRRYGLSVSLLFRWRRLIDGGARARQRGDGAAAAGELRQLRERIRELERLLGKKTLENELLREEVDGLQHRNAQRLAASAEDGLDNGAPGTIISSSREGTV
jgi:transposase